MSILRGTLFHTSTETSLIFLVGGTVVQQISLLPHSSMVPGSILSSSYYLCKVSHAFPMSVWVSSGLLPRPKDMAVGGLVT